eukprot:7493219-Alexandrium_andersonii.AAC.1
MPRRPARMGRGPTHPGGGKRTPSPRRPKASTAAGPVNPGASGGARETSSYARAQPVHMVCSRRARPANRRSKLLEPRTAALGTETGPSAATKLGTGSCLHE